MTFPNGTHWYVACLSRQLTKQPLARTMLSHPLVLYRDKSGAPLALLDRCPHRHAPLSEGRVAGGLVQCPYHGWTYNLDGTLRGAPYMEGNDAFVKKDI